MCPHLLKHPLMPNTMGQYSLSTLQWELQEFPFPIWVQTCHVSKHCVTIWGQKTSGTHSNHGVIGNSQNGQKTEVHRQLWCPNYWHLMACVHSNSDIELITNIWLSQVVENLGLSYHNTQELNRTINEEMPERLKFKCEEVQLSGVAHEFHFCKIIPCLRVLFGDVRFSNHLKFSLERHYQDTAHTVQAFGEMYTGKW